MVEISSFKESDGRIIANYSATFFLWRLVFPLKFHFKTGTEDKLVWYYDDKGNYFVRSGYRQALILKEKEINHASSSSNPTGRTQAFKQETQDLDVKNEQKKKLKASYGVTSSQELRRNQD
nr:hypothetical protein [Tanacetum cinerariifolium]